MGAPIAAGKAGTQARRLRVTEIFLSLQGEGRYSGAPTTFIRLTGCPLRCHYCDTTYAFHGGHWMGLDDILARVRENAVDHVCVTGGEPLVQPAVSSFLRELCNAGYRVSLETSGALDISPVDGRVCRVLDIKTPASGESRRNLWSNLSRLTAHDQIKFVLADRRDYEWARSVVQERGLPGLCVVWFSPVHGRLSPRHLAQWILEDRLQVRLQVQLHKYLWGDEPGR